MTAPHNVIQLISLDVWTLRTLAFVLVGLAPAAFGQYRLTADGVTLAYTQIENVLASAPETPDCSHPSFGPHITQALDSDVGKSVFVFNIHVVPDNDRCIAFDRQRVEIKTEGNSGTPDYLKGFFNDTVTFRWRFKLPSGFQPSSSFTHIHQIKAYDGDSGAPLMTLTPRLGNPDILQLIHIDSKGVTTYLTSTALAPFAGVWVEAYEKITYSYAGQYSLVVTRLTDGATLFSYNSSNLDLWRNGTTVVRPKWGIYRSLDHPDQLRDEQVEFDRFCLAKGTDDCASDGLPGDVNGDGVVNCVDLDLVRSAFGTRVGQQGYDPRADINSDGVIDITDLSFVARKLPAGTSCQ